MKNIQEITTLGLILSVLSVALQISKANAEPTWRLDQATGTLIIGGSGVIDYATGVQIRNTYQNSNIKHVIFEENSNITSIGSSVFQNYYNLKSVILPNTITSIGGYAFSGCSKLENINIPDSVTSIGDRAFASTKLQTVVIPSSLTSNGVGAFQGCTSLKEITVSGSQLFHTGAARLYKDDLENSCGDNPTLSKTVCDAARDYFKKNAKSAQYWYNASIFGNLDLSGVFINCRGDIATCESVMQYLNYGTSQGQKGAYNLIQKLADGSTAVYKNGKLSYYKNKRIYTVAEAQAVAGKKNIFKIRYK